MVFELSIFQIVLGAALCSAFTLLCALLIRRCLKSRRGASVTPAPDTESEPRDVLVGTLRNHMQLETCIKNNFYHIPAARLSPGDFPVHYVAIYQSNLKFGLDAGVRYFGEVKSSALVPRYKITEIPKNSREMYYRFDVKEWKTLPAPIVTREGDFVSIMTTRYLMENSREVPELMLRSRDEHALYRRISACISGDESTRKIEHGNACIEFDGGKITVYRGKTEILAWTYDEFSKRPSSVFRLMISAAEQGEKNR